MSLWKFRLIFAERNLDQWLKQHIKTNRTIDKLQFYRRYNSLKVLSD